MLRPVLLATLILALAGCDDSGDAGGDGTRASASAKITQRAIAAVALEHLSQDTTSRGPTYAEAPQGTLGADLRYGGGAGEDGDLVRVSLTPVSEPRPCATDDRHCAELDPVDDHPLSLRWEEVAPEEDPGYVVLTLVTDDQTLSVLYSGDDIEGDPRAQELSVPLDALVEVARDPRLRLSTDQDTVDAGERVDDWDEG